MQYSVTHSEDVCKEIRKRTGEGPYLTAILFLIGDGGLISWFLQYFVTSTAFYLNTRNNSLLEF